MRVHEPARDARNKAFRVSARAQRRCECACAPARGRGHRDSDRMRCTRGPGPVRVDRAARASAAAKPVVIRPDASADGRSGHERAAENRTRQSARAEARAVTFGAEIAFAQDWGRRQRHVEMQMRSVAGESPEAEPAAPWNASDQKRTRIPCNKTGTKTRRRASSARCGGDGSCDSSRAPHTHTPPPPSFHRSAGSSARRPRLPSRGHAPPHLLRAKRKRPPPRAHRA